MAAIEPISSVMTYQANAVKSVETVKPVETTEGQVEVNAPQVDNKTLSVSKAQTEEGENKGENGEKFNQEMMRQAMKELSKKATNVEAEFGIHEKTNRITIKMVDKKTKEVIKELPPEKMLDMLARMWEMSGLMVDEKR